MHGVHTSSLYTNQIEITCDVDVIWTMNDIEISVCSYTIPLNVQLWYLPMVLFKCLQEELQK
jgi:hypothetical protein